MAKSVWVRKGTRSLKYSTKLSLSSLRGMHSASPRITGTEPYISARRRPTTVSASHSTPNLPLLARCLTRIGSTLITAGRNSTDRMKAMPTPVAVMLPRWRNGGASLKFMLRKPMAVVRLVRKIG